MAQHAEALKHALRINTSTVIYGPLAVAAAASAAGHIDMARRAVEDVEQRSPGYGRQFTADALSRNLHPVLIKIMGGALRKAGMPVILDDCETPLQAASNEC